MFDEEYEVPEEIKAMFTDEFCKAFRKELFNIHEYYHLGISADDGPIQNTSTGGFVVALWAACMKTNQEDLFIYWDNLHWWQSDIFDDYLIQYMMENHYLLGYMEDILAQHSRREFAAVGLPRTWAKSILGRPNWNGFVIVVSMIVISIIKNNMPRWTLGE